MRNILRQMHSRGAAKAIAAKSGVPHRTIERILDGTSVPGFETLIRLFAAYPELLAIFEPIGGTWAGVALAAVECETLERQRRDALDRRDVARAKLRSLA